MTNVNLEPGDGRVARRPDRGHRRRAPDRDQPLVVDRRPAAALPVRGRGGLGDPRRRARPAAPQPELLGRDARSSGAAATRSAPRRTGGSPRCSTAARASRASSCASRTAARRRASGTWRWGLPDAARRSPSGRSRHAAGRDALVSVARERSLLLRFAANRPTQATAVDDLTVEIAVVENGHVGRASTNGTSDEAPRRLRAARRSPRPAPPPARRPARFPGFPALGPRPLARRPRRGHGRARARARRAGAGRRPSRWPRRPAWRRTASGPRPRRSARWCRAPAAPWPTGPPTRS